MFQGWEQVEKYQVIDLLHKLHGLFSKSECWTYYPPAVDAFGNEVQATDSAAVKWSLLGACDYLLASNYQEPLRSFVSCAARDFLNDISDDSLVHGKLDYEQEYSLIALGIEDLERVDV